MVVKAAPATPAMPQPMANVRRSVFLVLMPMALAITRLLTVARTRRPQRALYRASSNRAVTRAVRPMTNRPLIGMSRPSAGGPEPLRHPGRGGAASLGAEGGRKD